MTLLENFVYGTGIVVATAAGIVAYKKRMGIAWYLSSGYSYVKFYSSSRHKNRLCLMKVINAITHQPLKLEEGYEDYTELSYLWNNKKYTVIYEPFKKVLFPPYDEEKMLSAFVSDYEFYVRTNDSVTKIENENIIEHINEIIGPLCDFYAHVRGVISPRKCLLHYNIIQANQAFLMYDILTGEEIEF